MAIASRNQNEEINAHGLLREALLDWYARNKRELPWRRDAPDPYHVLLSEFMLQQTTVTAVKPYFAKFLEKWPDLRDLARADDDELMAAWAGLGYYSRARNLLLAVREIAEMDEFPSDVEALKKLAGVGDYTASAIAAIAFEVATVPIDGNVKRVLSRYHLIDDPIDKPSAALSEAAQKWVGDAHHGALAQAFMDLGSQICRPKNPNCDECPIAAGCRAAQMGVANEYPKRSPKKPKKQWVGHAYIIDTPEGIAFEKRGEKGLLANMLGLPSQMGEVVEFEPPISGDWQLLGKIEHIFTHIALSMQIWYIQLKDAPLSNQWIYLDEETRVQTAGLWKKALKELEAKNES